MPVLFASSEARQASERGTSMKTLRALLIRFGGLFDESQGDHRARRGARKPSTNAHRRQSSRRGNVGRSATPGAHQTRRSRTDQGKIPRPPRLSLHGKHMQDVRYGLRVLRNNPGVTVVAIVTLALAIGVNSTIFGVVNAILLRTPRARSGARRACQQRRSSKHIRGRSLRGFRARLSGLARAEHCVQRHGSG